jgi:hypothetical protein
MRASMTTDHNFEVSVITYREDSTWTALALEMNLRGYGSTVEAANDDLCEMLMAQVSFAVQMGHPESVWNRADDEYWRMFEEARRNQFVAELSGSQRSVDQFANMMPLPKLAWKQRDEWVAAHA